MIEGGNSHSEYEGKMKNKERDQCRNWEENSMFYSVVK